MPDQKENPIKTRIVRVKDKKTGVVYLEERRTQYDPEKGWNRVISTRRLGEKMLEAGGAPLKCSPKRRTSQELHRTPEATNVLHDRPDMMRILDWVGSASGLDRAVLDSFACRSAAEKAISVARYLLAAGRPVDEIETFQLNHDLPFGTVLTEAGCLELFTQLGEDDESIGRLFSNLKDLAGDVGDEVVFSSLVRTPFSWSGQTVFPPGGDEKDFDQLDDSLRFTRISAASGLPIAFDLMPAFPQDAAVVVSEQKRLALHGVRDPLFVLDGGFFSWEHIEHLIAQNVRFTLPAPLGDARVFERIDPDTEAGRQAHETFERFNSICPFTPEVTGFTISAETAVGPGAADEPQVKHLLHFHFYKNDMRAAELRRAFTGTLLDLKARVKSGDKDLTQSDLRLVDRYLQITKRGRSDPKAVFNESACRRVLMSLGIFVLVSNTAADCWEALRLERRRRADDLSFWPFAGALGRRYGKPWTRESSMGSEVCRLIALGYQRHLETALAKAVERAGRVVDNLSTPEAVREAHRSAADWLKEITPSAFLAWFDIASAANVMNSIGRSRWSAEIMDRDRLVLDLIMPKSSKCGSR